MFSSLEYLHVKTSVPEDKKPHKTKKIPQVLCSQHVHESAINSSSIRGHVHGLSPKRRCSGRKHWDKSWKCKRLQLLLVVLEAQSLIMGRHEIVLGWEESKGHIVMPV